MKDRVYGTKESGERSEQGATVRGGSLYHMVGAPAVPANAGDRDTPLQVAWLSLDEDDNDSTRFLSYSIAALRTVEADLAGGVLSALQSPQPPPALRKANSIRRASGQRPTLFLPLGIPLFAPGP